MRNIINRYQVVDQNSTEVFNVNFSFKTLSDEVFSEFPIHTHVLVKSEQHQDTILNWFSKDRNDVPNIPFNIFNKESIVETKIDRNLVYLTLFDGGNRNKILSAQMFNKEIICLYDLHYWYENGIIRKLFDTYEKFCEFVILGCNSASKEYLKNYQRDIGFIIILDMNNEL